MPSARLKKGSIEVRGETFHFREWTGVERAEFFKRSKEDQMRGVIYLAHRCSVTEEGKAVWQTEAAAGEEPPEITDAIANAIAKLSTPVEEGDDGKKV